MEAGQPPDRFWTLTPRQVEAELKAVAAQQRMHRDEIIFAAWHTAYLHRVEKFPKLSDLLKTPSGKGGKRKRTWEEQAAEAQAWAIKAANKE
jgi:hypothetical protein